MAVKSKTQLGIDIAASTFSAPQQTILEDMVDSYEDIFPQLTTVQRDALTPTNGQVVYNTDNARYEYWNGSAWFGIGQDLSTPLVVKVNVTSAEILALNTTPKTLVAAPGAGLGLLCSSVTYRYTYLTSAYTTNLTLNVIASTKDVDDYQVRMTDALDGSVSTLVITPADSPSNKVCVVDNDSLVLKASGGNPAAGAGSLSLWVTYSIITL
jgi:hypothetical protein